MEVPLDREDVYSQNTLNSGHSYGSLESTLEFLITQYIRPCLKKRVVF